ncbi:peptidoglycan-binding protein [Streptomyces sp. NPDC094049]|uniref:peptidoglycan-binding protein n=1 Tax=Streptomyces sp. NPDC094049 TaxID=3154987 RepID=UPI003330FE87
MRSEGQDAPAAPVPPAQVEALRLELVRVKEDKKLSLDAFAHDTQYSRSSWNRVLKGGGFPPREAVERLCSRRRIAPAHLLELWDAADTARRVPTAVPPPQPVSANPPGTGAGAAAAGTVTGQNPDTDSGGATSPPASTSPDPGAAAGSPPPSATVPQTRESLDSTADPGTRCVPPNAPSVSPRLPADPTVPPAPGTPAEQDAEPVPPAAGPMPTNSTGIPNGTDTDTAIVRTLTSTISPARKRGRLPVKLLVLTGLVVVLALGRWAAWPDHKETASPPLSGSRPTDAQPPASSQPLVSSRPPEGTGTEQAAANDDKPDGGQATTTAPGTSTGPNGTSTSPAPGTPSPDTPDRPGTTDPSTSPAAATATPSPRPTTAPATSAPSTVPLGAEGRANCDHNSDRIQTMAKGMVGSKVSQIQCFLVHNYDYDSLRIDSNFGPATETAVRAVQQCSGIKVDGQVGPKTWRYLEYPMAGCGH